MENPTQTNGIPLLTAEQMREAIKQHSFGIQPELGYGEFGRCFHGKSWQAIADELNGLLGIERDTIYNAGFDNGVKATLQQLDGLLISTDSVVDIQAWADEQWEECES